MLGTFVAATTACAALPWASNDPKPVIREEGGVVVWVWDGLGDPDRPAMTAIMEGVVAVDDAGCVLLQQDHGGTTPVVWPAGTELASAAPLKLVFADGTEVTSGDAVTSGGGYVPADTLFGRIDDRPCIADGDDVAVINPREGVRRP